MIFADHLYPATELPAWLDPLWSSPEVQRLRQVRLVNAASPTIAALSDVRRFSHLLGVTALAMSSERDIVDFAGEAAFRTFAAATVLHDIGTPAFGHLFEYLLNARSGWSHEGMVLDILRDAYNPSSLHHQIYAGRRPNVAAQLDRLGLVPEEVDALIRGVGPLGTLLSGVLDIDNIDNVFRMASHLGLDDNSVRPLDVAAALTLDDAGQVVHEWGLPSIKQWRHLRRAAYERMLFDGGCVAAQAMLTHALAEALEQELLGPEHWDLTDEQLVARLSRNDAVRRFAVGDFYAMIFLGWFDGEPAVDLRRPDHGAALRSALEEALQYRCHPYVYYDRGTLEKQLDLRIRESTGAVAPYVLGTRSSSTIVGVVTPLRDAVSPRRDTAAIADVLGSFGLSADERRPIPEPERVHGVYQTQLPI